MRFVPLDELLAARGLTDVLALGFPFSSQRAATVGDPSLHGRRDAEELFLLALLRLSATLGSPDFPSADRATPEALQLTDGPVALWDYDYHREILAVIAEPDHPAMFRVQLLRQQKDSTITPARTRA